MQGRDGNIGAGGGGWGGRVGLAACIRILRILGSLCFFFFSLLVVRFISIEGRIDVVVLFA